MTARQLVPARVPPGRKWRLTTASHQHNLRPSALSLGGSIAAATSNPRDLRASDRRRQLHRRQRPTAQEHTGRTGPARRGPHWRTHSSAPGSDRSPMPPGQQKHSIAARSRSVSDRARLETDSMCVAIAGSAGWASIHLHRPKGVLALEASQCLVALLSIAA